MHFFRPIGITRRKLLGNITAAFIYIIVLSMCLLAADKLGMPHMFGYMFNGSLITFFLVSLYMNRNSFVNVKNSHLRYFLIIVLCMAITAVTGYISSLSL